MKTKKRKKLPLILLCLALVAAAVLGGLKYYGKKQMEKIPALSFRDCLAYTLGGEKDGVITVGVLQNGEMRYTVYGADGQEIDHALHIYEIGSLTKTLTAALVGKAVAEGKLQLDAPIDRYVTLPKEGHAPTIRELLTHTSGYPEYYFESEMIGNFLAGRNSFCGIGKDKLLRRLGSADVKEEPHGFRYSNFGYATLGLILEQVYGTNFTRMMNDSLRAWGMPSSHMTDGAGDLGNYWDWRRDDAYLPAGGVLSNIEDMLTYAALVLNGTDGFDTYTASIKEIRVASESYEQMNIRMDAVGYGWMIDEENGIIWHNGGTGHYNAYLGVKRDAGTAVVILPNLSPSKKIPATVMGAKLLLEISGGE